MSDNPFIKTMYGCRIKVRAVLGKDDLPTLAISTKDHNGHFTNVWMDREQREAFRAQFEAVMKIIESGVNPYAIGRREQE